MNWFFAHRCKKKEAHIVKSFWRTFSFNPLIISDIFKTKHHKDKTEKPKNNYYLTISHTSTKDGRNVKTLESWLHL